MIKNLILFLLLGLSIIARGQSFILRGKIIDLKTKAAIPFATVKTFPSKKATLSDSIGYFKITSLKGDDSLEISASGYGKQKVSINSLRDQVKEGKSSALISMKSCLLYTSPSPRD